MSSVAAIKEAVTEAIQLDQNQRRQLADDTRDIITSLERLADLRLDSTISGSEFEVSLARSLTFGVAILNFISYGQF